jgi:hypothetical protein
MTINLSIYDDNHELLSILDTHFTKDKRFHVQNLANNVDNIIFETEKDRPDLILLDVSVANDKLYTILADIKKCKNKVELENTKCENCIQKYCNGISHSLKQCIYSKIGITDYCIHHQKQSSWPNTGMSLVREECGIIVGVISNGGLVQLQCLGVGMSILIFTTIGKLTQLMRSTLYIRNIRDPTQLRRLVILIFLDQIN